MDANNLALVIGPNCMRTEENQGLSMMSDSPYIQFLMRHLIMHHEFVN